MKTVIIGASEVAVILAKMLSSNMHDVTIIHNEDRDLRHLYELDLQIIEGDATHRALLKQAAVSQATLVASVSHNASYNLVSSALASELGAQISIAVVEDPGFFSTSAAVEYDVLGVEAVLNTARLAGQEIMKRIRKIDLDFVVNLVGASIQVLLVPIRRLNKVPSQAPSELSLPHGTFVPAVLRDGDLIAAQEVHSLDIDDQLMVVGTPALISSALHKLGVPSSRGRVMIVGGSSAGAQLARRLSREGRRVQLIEASERRAVELAEDLESVTILNADGSNLALLEELEVQDVEYMITATSDDELNLTTALMSKQLGTMHAFALMNRAGYGAIYERLGVNGVVSRDDTLSKNIMTIADVDRSDENETIKGSHHVLEIWRAPSNMKENFSLNALNLPPQAILLGIVRRAQALQPGQTEAIRPRDSLVFAVPQSQIKALRRVLSKFSN